MTRPVSFHRLASEELGEAVNFYELESTGLGATFLSVVEHALSQLEELPESAPVAHGRIRKKPIGRFPYCLLFEVREDGIRILALMHQSRRPFCARAPFAARCGRQRRHVADVERQASPPLS